MHDVDDNHFAMVAATGHITAYIHVFMHACQHHIGNSEAKCN